MPPWSTGVAGLRSIIALDSELTRSKTASSFCRHRWQAANYLAFSKSMNMQPFLRVQPRTGDGSPQRSVAKLLEGRLPQQAIERVPR